VTVSVISRVTRRTDGQHRDGQMDSTRTCTGTNVSQGIQVQWTAPRFLACLQCVRQYGQNERVVQTNKRVKALKTFSHV
jgi:hypothetical protein